jgi:hypothetical protein
VKRELLILHPLDRFLDPIKQWLIRDAGRYRTVMLDLLVDLYTLLAHCTSPLSGGSNQATCHDITPVELFCFNPTPRHDLPQARADRAVAQFPFSLIGHVESTASLVCRPTLILCVS